MSFLALAYFFLSAASLSAAVLVTKRQRLDSNFPKITNRNRMKCNQKHVKILILLPNLLLTITSLFAQTFIAEKKDWYRPDYAVLNVDTVKVCSGNLVGQTHFSDEIKMSYDKQGYLTFFEKAHYHIPDKYKRLPIINPEMIKIYNKVYFYYDEKMKLIQISLENNKSYYQEFDMGIEQNNLRKYGGLLPDSYENQAFDKLYHFMIKIKAINFKYDLKGNPTKEIVNFRTYKITPNLSSHPTNYVYSPIRIKEDTLILNGHNLEYFSKLGITTVNYGRFTPEIEQRFSNCKNKDLTNKILWAQELSSSFCPQKASSPTKSEIPINTKTPVLKIARVYNKEGQVVLKKTKSGDSYYSYSKQFNCAKVTYNSFVKNFKYDEKGLLTTETGYSTFNIATGSLLPKPFCIGQDDVMYILSEKIFMVKSGETSYSYDSAGLLTKEVIIHYDYSKSENRRIYGKPALGQNPECYKTCFEMNKSEKIKYYTYTFHPKP